MVVKKTKRLAPFPPVIGWGVALLLVAVAVGALYLYIPPSYHPISPLPTVHEKITNIPHFSSEADIIAKFQAAQQSGNMSGGGSVMREDAAVPSATPTASGDSGKSLNSSGSNYSTTNVQVQGVDEADIVKTDGEYIYSFYKNKLVITHAIPADDMKVVATLSLDSINPEQMYVSGNKLVLFGNSYSSNYGPNIYSGEKMMAMPIRGYWNQSRAIVYEYDISDKSNPVVDKRLEFPGSNLTSRMIGDNVYFVINTYPYYPILYGGYGGIAMPMVKSTSAATPEATTTPSDDTTSIIPPYVEDGVEKPLADPTDIGYLPPINAQSFLTIGSLNVNTHELQKETIVGSAEQAFASLDNLYLTSTQWNYPQPIPLAGDARIGIMPVYYNPDPETMVYKFHLQNGSISFQGRGSVPGHVLNQFSMDEYAGNFRIAVTQDAQYDNQGQISEQQRNAVYVLNEDMDTVGSLTDVAPGEQIYSVRFINERAYMVTFQQIDPLFVLDLSDASNPHILGKLKIPGYSNYLHPLDSTHILGVGKDTTTSQKGDFAYYLGMKMAIFDVSDVEHPIQQYTINVGDRGTDSPALYDHKAFLYDADKQMLVLPIDYKEILERQDAGKSPFDWPDYGTTTFQGAIAYHVSVSDGFKELGRVTHIPADVDLKSGYYYDYRYMVQRALFIGNTLYTISPKMIKANDATSLAPLSSVELAPIAKDFVITAKSNGVFCAGPCGYQQVILNKDKIIQDSSSGTSTPTINHSERPVSSEYDDIVEQLDWSAFQALDETQGCPGCADGPVETITITKGNVSKTVTMEAGMRIEKIQTFLDAINGYIGVWGGPYYYAIDSGSGGGSAGATTATAPPAVTP